jgi:PKD repeat protein
MNFRDLLYTQPVNGAKHTLVARPANGDICYVTMNGGEVRCFSYEARNVPPTVVPGAVENSCIAPCTIQFKADGTFDRENDEISLVWDFGDGSATSTQSNPLHQYTTAGVYNVTLTGTDKYGNSASGVLKVYTNNIRPKVKITSPARTFNGIITYFSNTTNVVFAANVVDSNADLATLSYKWEFQLVHFSHVHPDVQSRTDVTFNAIGGALPNEGALERNNLNVVLHVTDAGGLEGVDNIRLAPDNWLSLFKSNSAPIPNFTYNTGVQPLQVGQPVIFDAQSTTDPDNDRIDYTWDFGDGINGTGVLTTHLYDSSGIKNVKLYTNDNWGNLTTITKQITISAKKAIPPVISPASGEKYNVVPITFSSIDPTAAIYYTTDGSTPSATSTSASIPYQIPYQPYVNFTVKAISYVTSLDPSTVSVNNYAILPPPCNQLALEQFCNLRCVNPETPLKNGTVTTLPSNPGFNYAGTSPVLNR